MRAVGRPTSGKNWNPGWYVKYQGNHAAADTSSYWSGLLSYMDGDALDETYIQGVMFFVGWGDIERSDGVYTWTNLDAAVTKAAQNGLKIILAPTWKAFNADHGSLYPPQWNSEGEVGVTEGDYYPHTSGSGITMAVWNSAIMADFIALMEAIAARYDSGGVLEAVRIADEWATSISTTPPFSSWAAYQTQLEAAVDACAAAFRKAWVIAPINANLGGTAESLMEYAYQAGLGAGFPDLYLSLGEVIFRGDGVAPQESVRDYRGLMMHEAIISSPVMNPEATEYGFPIGDLQTNEIDPNSYSHISVVTTAAYSGADWDTDIRPHLDTHTVSMTTEPTPP